MRFAFAKADTDFDIALARGPPLWEGCDAQADDSVHGEPDWDLAAQPSLVYELFHF